jgi:hypothetical protein
MSNEFLTNDKHRQETVSNNVLTLSKSCKKEILRIKYYQKGVSAKSITPSSDRNFSPNNHTSKSSLLVCNEHLRNLEVIDGNISPSHPGLRVRDVNNTLNSDKSSSGDLNRVASGGKIASMCILSPNKVMIINQQSPSPEEDSSQPSYRQEQPSNARDFLEQEPNVLMNPEVTPPRFNTQPDPGAFSYSPKMQPIPEAKYEETLDGGQRTESPSIREATPNNEDFELMCEEKISDIKMGLGLASKNKNTQVRQYDTLFDTTYIDQLRQTCSEVK